MAFDFNLYRSLIYVGLSKEEYRVKLNHWLYKYHLNESLSNFGPYCTQYSYYPCFPTPEEGDRFGSRKMQMTEHYWLVDEHMPEMKNRALTEYMPMDVLRWQGCIPDIGDDTSMNAESGDAGRAVGGDNGCPPFIFSFIPVNWEQDLKGSGRTAEDGPNYRWQFLISYPDGVDKAEGEKWFEEEVVPVFRDSPLVIRFLTSKVCVNYGAKGYDRVVGIWFEGPDEWYQVAVEGTKNMKKPSWAEQDEFPFLRPQFNIASVFLGDIPSMSTGATGRGYVTMR